MSDAGLAKILRTAGSKSNAQPERPPARVLPSVSRRYQGETLHEWHAQHAPSLGRRLAPAKPDDAHASRELSVEPRATARRGARVHARPPLPVARTSDPLLARSRDARVRRPMAARLRRPVSVCAHHFVK
jgi:hypothetical protein